VCRGESVTKFVAKHRHGITQMVAAFGALACVAATAGTAASICLGAAAATFVANTATSYADNINDQENPNWGKFGAATVVGGLTAFAVPFGGSYRAGRIVVQGFFGWLFW
jgi:hypothetical protein